MDGHAAVTMTDRPTHKGHHGVTSVVRHAGRWWHHPMGCVLDRQACTGAEMALAAAANIVDADVELPDVAGTLKLRSWHHITEEWGVTNDAVGDESLRAPQLGRRMDRDDGRQHLGSRAT